MSNTAIKPRTEHSLSPHSLAKRDAILEAAKQAFMAHGFGDTSMDQIAADAGVSKQTVYSHFGAKNNLFEAIITSKCAALMDAGGLGAVSPAEPMAALTVTAERFLTIVIGDESITLYRVILAESGRFPELARTFYRAGPSVAAGHISRYLAQCQAAGTLRIEDPDAAAKLFFAMLRGDLYLRRVLGIAPMPSAAVIAEQAREIAAAFVRAHGGKSEPGSDRD